MSDSALLYSAPLFRRGPGVSFLRQTKPPENQNKTKPLSPAAPARIRSKTDWTTHGKQAILLSAFSSRASGERPIDLSLLQGLMRFNCQMNLLLSVAKNIGKKEKGKREKKNLPPPEKKEFVDTHFTPTRSWARIIILKDPISPHCALLRTTVCVRASLQDRP